jgi:sensor histidine kinase YesM
MMEPQALSGIRIRWALLFAIGLAAWLMVGLVDSAWYYIISATQAGPKGPPDWSRVLIVNIPYWILASLLTPPVVWITRRIGFRLGGYRLLRALGFHLLGVMLFTVVHLTLFRLIRLYQDGKMEPLEIFLRLIPQYVATTLDKELLLYFAIVGTLFAWDSYHRYRERERAAAALEIERARLQVSLSQAKLEALKMQLQPHFLFNALHAISTLILKGDARGANQMLSHLSHFLRMTLDSTDAPVIPLALELEFLEAYLRIQKERFRDRLQVEIDVAEEALGAQVPNLILQPLVENSIRHGIGAAPAGGVIAIRGRREAERLVLEVEDNGTGLTEEERVTEGVGLGNVRARLAQLHPQAHTLELRRAPAGGTVARITIPFHRADAAEGKS